MGGNMKSVFCVLFVYLIAICDSGGNFKINKICTQPRGDVCMEIRKCPYFADLLDRTTIPRPRHIIKIIRDHHCGFYGNSPKICCTLPASTTTRIARYQKYIDPPDVSQHKNLDFLPFHQCGPISNEFRIISGSKTVPMEFPWMALIAYRTDEGLDFRCSGTVINERYILTAAHCTRNLTVVGIRLGEHNINTVRDCDIIKGTCAPPVQDFYIEDIIVHPDYIATGFQNDIALIRLATPANFSNGNVQPICLPVGNAQRLNLDGKFAIISGWGVTEDGFKSEDLLKTSVPIVPNDQCKRTYQRHSVITYKQICAGGYLGRDSCGGDSGGPLKYIGKVEGTARYVQYGIVSYGPRHCGTEGQPGVYTRVAHYMDWILDNLKPSD